MPNMTRLRRAPVNANDRLETQGIDAVGLVTTPQAPTGESVFDPFADEDESERTWPPLRCTFAGIGQTQLVVPEPSFRRGVASIVDIRGKLAMFREGNRPTRHRTVASVLRSDRRRIAGDFAAVRPRRMTHQRAEEIMGTVGR